MTSSINWLAVAVATISAFIVGALWYGPLFGKAWKDEINVPEGKLKDRSMAWVFGSAFVLELIIAVNLAIFLSDLPVREGVLYGFLAGFGWIAMAMGVTYLFSGKSLKLWFIDSFYFVVSLTLMGLILTAWPG